MDYFEKFKEYSNDKFNYKYDYSEAVYKGVDTPLKIICPIHGVTYMRPVTHMRSLTGCKQCGSDLGNSKKFSKQEDVLDKIKALNKDYDLDYSDFKYLGDKKKSQIRCEIHGLVEGVTARFLISPACVECSRVRRLQDNRLKAIKSFKERTEKVHKNKFIYDFTNFQSTNSKIGVWCPFHGWSQQRVGYHLKTNHGCKRCFECTLSANNSIDTEEYIKRCTEVHDGYYTYEKTVYTSQFDRVVITCPKHGDFKQVAHNHRGGAGCHQCALIRLPGGYCHTTINRDSNLANKPCSIYFVELFGEESGERFYKIGISTVKLYSRFKLFKPYKASRIIVGSSNLKTCFNVEQELLAEHFNKSYTPLVGFGGKTECLYNLSNDERNAIIKTIANNFKIIKEE